jgi:hypothetical protein
MSIIQIHIITVLTINHRVLWEKNYEKIISQNKNRKLNFYIAADKRDKLKLIESIEENKNVIINIIELAVIDEKVQQKFKGSYQHGASLNECLNLCSLYFNANDLLVIIDPDLFVIGDDWIGKLYKNFDFKEFNTYAIPWSPRWALKSDQSIPPHLIVTNRCPQIDMRPSMEEDKSLINFLNKIINKFKLVNNTKEEHFNTNNINIQYPKKYIFVRWPRLIRKDTAYKLFKYCNNYGNIKLMNPLIEINEYADYLWVKIKSINYDFEKFIPAGFRLKNINTKIIFYDNRNELIDLPKTNWEFFVSDDKDVYVFHVRGYMNNNLRLKTAEFNNKDFNILCEILKEKLV